MLLFIHDVNDGPLPRLRQVCSYTATTNSQSPPIPTPGPTADILRNDGDLTPSNIKFAIIQKLSGIEPNDVAPIYSNTVGMWLPVVSEPRLNALLPATWDDATVESCLLALSIVLLNTSKDHGSKVDTDTNFMSLYLRTKSWVALLEGLGINCLEVVQSRLFITLFECAHGLYPAAYVSIGAAIRAAEAILVSRESHSANSGSQSVEEEKEERITWCGIVILDR